MTFLSFFCLSILQLGHFSVHTVSAQTGPGGPNPTGPPGICPVSRRPSPPLLTNIIHFSAISNLTQITGSTRNVPQRPLKIITQLGNAPSTLLLLLLPLL